MRGLLRGKRPAVALPLLRASEGEVGAAGETLNGPDMEHGWATGNYSGSRGGLEGDEMEGRVTERENGGHGAEGIARHIPQ